MTDLNIKYHQLSVIAAALGGSLRECSTDNKPYIYWDTDDNTSKENYDDLLTMIAEDIAPALTTYEIYDTWADHNTQLITFTKIEE